MKTRVTISFVVEHDSDRMLGSFNPLDFIQGGLWRVGLSDVRVVGCVTQIEPGARLNLAVVGQRRKL